MHTNSFKIQFFYRNDKVTLNDENGKELECVHTAGKGWHVIDDEDKKCIKRVSYYQWIPYVLLLQVRSIIIVNNFVAYDKKN